MGNLEREALDLAHVWPKTYPSLEEGKEKTTSYWFIGLVIKVRLGEDICRSNFEIRDIILNGGGANVIKRYRLFLTI